MALIGGKPGGEVNGGRKFAVGIRRISLTLYVLSPDLSCLVSAFFAERLLKCDEIGSGRNCTVTVQHSGLVSLSDTLPRKSEVVVRGVFLSREMRLSLLGLSSPSLFS